MSACVYVNKMLDYRATHTYANRAHINCISTYSRGRTHNNYCFCVDCQLIFVHVTRIQEASTRTFP